jgi:hypothetical protein
MRRPSLTVPIVALTLLLGLTLLPANPAAALLGPTPTPTTMTQVVIADAPPPVAGQPYGFTVILRTTSDQQPVPNATVRLWARRPGQSTYSQVAQTHTDASGVAEPVTTLSRNTYLYAEFPGDYSGTYAPSHTDPVLTYVSTAGTMRVNDKTLRLGQRLVVTGRTRPAKPGRRVALYVGRIPSPTSPHRPTRIARAYVRADGTYRITERFHSAGRKRLFVKLPGGDGNVTGYTRYQRVRVG